MRTRASLALVVLAGLAFGQAGAAPAAEGGPAVGTDFEGFVIGIEDVLRIFVWGEPTLGMTVKVRPDGRITIPLINDIAVEGLTPDQVRQKIAQGLAEFVRNPNVTVIVEQINSFRVYFLGEVKVQGALQFYRPTRLLQAIASAGGLTEFSKKEITLVRQEGGGEKRLEIDYKRLVSGDPAQENLYLKAGDVLLVK